MTEREWLSSSPLGSMLYYIEDIASERKIRLFVLACCRRVERYLVDERSRAALEGLEQHIEGRQDLNDLRTHYAFAKEASDAIEAPLYIDGALYANAESLAAGAVFCATNPDVVPTSRQSHTLSSISSAAHHARGAVSDPVYRRSNSSEEAEAADAAEAAVQAGFLRDIFGNPFRTVALDPAWLTADVLALARGIYDDRAFDRMPILADALQDAGCDNDDVLSHCRSDGPHARGCWVVDMVLGKA